MEMTRTSEMGVVVRKLLSHSSTKPVFGRPLRLLMMTPLIFATTARSRSANVCTSSSSESSATTTNGNDRSQSIFIVRHGDRWDYNHPEFTTSRRGDSPLSDLGHIQARETGVFLNNRIFLEDKKNITVLCSPFLRCIETANGIVQQFTAYPAIKILLEHSVWELDGHHGVNHQHVASGQEQEYLCQERSWYFPRIDTSHVSMFVPTLPESKEDSLIRFQRVMDAIHLKYPYNPNEVLIIVTHAAACIGLVKAATGKGLQEITPAGPCSIFRLQRLSNLQNKWDIDPYYLKDGMNGHIQHITNAGKFTIPWNNYGPRCTLSKRSKYTGPPRSEIEHLFQYQPEYVY